MLEEEGKISPKVVKEFDRATKGKYAKLPGHVKPKKKAPARKRSPAAKRPTHKRAPRKKRGASR